MYRLLIVDDEIHAVNGIKSGIQWDGLSIIEIHTAYNNRQAKEVFADHAIDLMICDIEMPQGNGLELLAWVRENYGATKCIFLTCHADFQYAKEAIRLGSFDYLLKPVIFAELEDVLRKAIAAIQKERIALPAGEKSGHYYDLWLMHQPLLIERFWMDLIDGKIPAEAEAVRQALLKSDISYTQAVRFLPVLIKLQRWHNKLLLRDERRKEHELRNKSLSMLLRDDRLSQVLQLRRGQFLALHAIESGEAVNKARLTAEYHVYLESVAAGFECDLSCYVGPAVEICRIPEAYEALQDYSKNYVVMNRVLFTDEHIVLQKPAAALPMSGWSELFAQSRRDIWRREADQVFDSLSRLDSFDSTLLHELFHDFMQTVFSVMKQKDLPAHQLFAQGERLNEDELSLNSVDALQEMVTRIGEHVFDLIQEADKDRSITERIKVYIAQNMGYDLTREAIAREFYLNPDYLTRIFKKETGISISDYLIQERIRIAKDLLIHTDMPVKEIVSKVGYTNFSYFSKIFKDITNQNPLAFRKTNTH